MSSVMRYIGCDHRWLAVASVGLLSVAWVAPMPSLEAATIITTVGDYGTGGPRATWETAAASESGVGVQVEDLESLTAGTSLLPSGLVNSSSYLLPSFPVYNNSPAVPDTDYRDSDLGKLMVRVSKGRQSGSSDVAFSVTAGGFSGSKVIGGSGSGSKWNWARFQPKDSSAWSSFAVDMSGITNDFSGVGYTSWHIYFNDGTTPVVGRLWNGTDVIDPAYTYFAPARPNGNHFIGFRDSQGKGTIAAVEFFTKSNSNGYTFDNLSFTAVAAVPEPASLGLVGVGLVGILSVARRARR